MTARTLFVETVAEALARCNGFYLSKAAASARRVPHPTAAQLANNPGLLKHWPTVASWPAHGKTIAFFETERYGWSALYATIHTWVQRNTPLGEFPYATRLIKVLNKKLNVCWTVHTRSGDAVRELNDVHRRRK